MGSAMPSTPLPDLVVVVGPTASGKTALAMELAQRLDAEIVGADSVQIYRHFDIGSAKPSPEERCRVRHHLVDCIDPMDGMDAAQWATCAAGAIEELRGQKKHAVVCGGTFLWVRALLYGLAQAPAAQPDLRERLREWAERWGRPALHDWLKKVDPEAASRIAPNDFVRVSRALEVVETTGVPLSTWQERHRFSSPRYRHHLVGRAHTREELDRNIETRIHDMLERGWIDEVRGLLSSGFQGARAMGSVGYRQVRAAIEAGSEPDRAALFQSVRRATRTFARRQRTWLRDVDVQWLTLEGVSDWLRANPQRL